MTLSEVVVLFKATDRVGGSLLKTEKSLHNNPFYDS